MLKYVFLMEVIFDGEYMVDLMFMYWFVGVFYIDDMIEYVVVDFVVQVDFDGDWDGFLECYFGVVVSNFDGEVVLMEMDVLIVYLQVFGMMVDFLIFILDVS